MTFLENVFNRLFNFGRPWRGKATEIAAFNSALVEEFQLLRIFFKEVRLESLPETATNLLPEHAFSLGIVVKTTDTIPELQDRLFSRDTGLGAQDIVYLQQQLDRAGYTVTLCEFDANVYFRVGIGRVNIMRVGAIDALDNANFKYLVKGSVTGQEEFNRLLDDLEYYVGAHLEPIFDFIVPPDPNLSSIFGVTGVGITGISFTGNTP